MKIKNHPASKLLTASLILCILLFSKCKKEEPLEKGEISSDQNLIESMSSENLISATSAPAGAYNIQNALPSGYVKDGSRDYTTYIQKAIDSHSEIVFPGFPIMVNDAGLVVGSNKRITFLNGSQIRLKPTSKSSYNIFDIRGVSNVTLVDPVVIGDRNNHNGTSGEAGVGIGIRGSSNVTLTNPNVSNCWGDGLYIGVHNGIGSKKVTITNGSVKNNRRDGLSIISVEGLLINGFYAGFNNGTSPQCGINFEPDATKDELKNIVINNAVTEGNLGYGIQMGFTNIFGAGNKYVDITINNHIDKQSKKAIKMSSYTSKRSGSEIISVNVVYNNPSWKHHPLTPKDIIAVALFEDAQKLTIKTPSIQTATGVQLSTSAVTSTLSRLFNSGSNVLLSYSSTPTVITNPTPTIEPTSSTGEVVFAVNAGGSEYTFNGIRYLSDRNYSGGSVFKNSAAIYSTSADVLYQSERFGNFSYAVPVADGTYEVTLKMAEIYHTAIGKRRFDVRFEGVEQISNLDLYSVAGRNQAYDLVRTVNVTDGTLNINFVGDVDKAKLSAFHVVKK